MRKQLAVSTVRKYLETMGFVVATNVKEHYDQCKGLAMGIYNQSTSAVVFVDYDPTKSNMIVFKDARWKKPGFGHVHIKSYYYWPKDHVQLWKMGREVRETYSELCGTVFKEEPHEPESPDGVLVQRPAEVSGDPEALQALQGEALLEPQGGAGDEPLPPVHEGGEGTPVVRSLSQQIAQLTCAIDSASQQGLVDLVDRLITYMYRDERHDWLERRDHRHIFMTMLALERMVNPEDYRETLRSLLESMKERAP